MQILILGLESLVFLTVYIKTSSKGSLGLRNTGKLFLGKKCLSQVNWANATKPQQPPSRLKITAGRGCATPQQQASKSVCQEYPVYHQREKRCQASQGLRIGSRLWRKHRKTGTRHGKPASQSSSVKHSQPCHLPAAILSTPISQHTMKIILKPMDGLRLWKMGLGNTGWNLRRVY